MSVLRDIVLSILFFQSLFLQDFGSSLGVQFDFHQSSSLSLSSRRLLLLFKMEKGVEFLDGCPLVFFLNVRVWFLLCLGRSSDHWLHIWGFLSLRHLVLALWSTSSGSSSGSSAWSSTCLRFHVFIAFARSCSLGALGNSALGILFASPLC